MARPGPTRPDLRSELSADVADDASARRAPGVTADAADDDAPKAGAVRECSDRVARMERDLADLKARLEAVQNRRAAVMTQGR